MRRIEQHEMSLVAGGYGYYSEIDETGGSEDWYEWSSGSGASYGTDGNSYCTVDNPYGYQWVSDQDFVGDGAITGIVTFYDPSSGLTTVNTSATGPDSSEIIMQSFYSSSMELMGGSIAYVGSDNITHIYGFDRDGNVSNAQFIVPE